MARIKQNTRKAILDAAYVLFRQRGFTRVNVDEIAASAGITKRTLYSHFPSKDDLLEEVLKIQHDLALAAFQTFGKTLTGTPHEIVKTYFSELVRWSQKPQWEASGFTRLAMELPDMPGHPARRIARHHKAALESHLAHILGKAGLPDAERKTRQIWILTEGSMALMLIHGNPDYYVQAEEAAQLLIASQ